MVEVEALSDGVAVAGSVKNPELTWNVLKLNNAGLLDLNFGDVGSALIPMSGTVWEINLQGQRFVVSGVPAYATLNKNFSIARLDHGLNSSFIVSPSVKENGTINPPVPVEVVHSAIAEFTVIPNLGFRIVSVTGCGNGELIGSRYRTAPVVGNCAVQAIFEAIP